jgi:5-methylcytosine-specific restriction protein A
MQLDWTREELLLALDLYLRTRPRPPRERNPEVIELSEVLRALPIHPVEGREPQFRSPRSVYSKMGNFQRADPESDWKGLSHGANLDEVIWNEYAHKPELVAELAAAIRAGVALPRAEVVAAQESDEAEAEEGGVVLAQHRRRERKPGLAKKKREAFRKQHGRLYCEACGLEFRQRYGDDIGEGVSDVHHLVPLAVAGPSITRLSNLVLLCANCHRAVHRMRPMDVKTLRHRLGGA